jgi:hypothetical protein
MAISIENRSHFVAAFSTPWLPRSVDGDIRARCALREAPYASSQLFSRTFDRAAEITVRMAFADRRRWSCGLPPAQTIKELLTNLTQGEARH